MTIFTVMVMVTVAVIVATVAIIVTAVTFIMIFTVKPNRSVVSFGYQTG